MAKSKSNVDDDKHAIASIIVNMKYSVLMEIANELANSASEKDVRPRLQTADEFASLLYDWAEAID